MKKMKTLLHMLQKLKEIIPYKYKREIPVVFFMMIVSSVFEMLGVAIIIPFMSTLTDVERLVSNQYIGYLFNLFHLDGFYSILLFMGISVVCIYIVKNCILLVARNYQNIYQCNIQSALSVEMLKTITRRPYAYFLGINSSELLTGVFNDSNNIYNIINAFLSAIGECLTIMMIGIFVFITDPIMAICLVALSLFCGITIVFGLKRKSAQEGVKYRDSYNRMYQDAMQTIGGIKEINVTDSKDYFLNRFETERNRFGNAQKTWNFYNLIPERIIETVFVSIIALVMVYKVRWGMDVTDSIVNLSAFAVAGFRFLPSVNKISNNFNTLIYFQPSLEATYNNVMEVRQFENERLKMLENTQKKEAVYANIQFRNSIEIKSVSFAYGDKQKSVLKDINLEISKGESIGIIGESGAGKTTLSDIILGLLIPQSGDVYMDGIDINMIPSTWSKMIGYVPQSVYLLDATIKENIAFGIEENNISEKKVWKVIEQSQLSDLVQSLPEGIETLVGERGVRLSGGQRQRIAIARALYRDPDILVLDEATSALDGETENAVIEAIDSLKNSKTLIIIAHRLSTIASCDMIYEIKNGEAIKRVKNEVVGDVVSNDK